MHSSRIYGAMAWRARQKRAPSVEPMTPSATAEVVRIAAALWLQRTRQQRACGTRAASSSFCNPRDVSHGQPMSLEAHGVVQHTVDGLRATGFINSQRLVPMWWSADLTTAPTCTAEERMQTAQHRQQTGRRSSPAGRSESYIRRLTLALDVPCGLVAAELKRKTSRGLVRSRMVGLVASAIAGRARVVLLPPVRF